MVFHVGVGFDYEGIDTNSKNFKLSMGQVINQKKIKKCRLFQALMKKYQI